MIGGPRVASVPQSGVADDSPDPAGLRKRDAIIRVAAVRQFYLHGYDAVGIRQIATDAEINSATLYHYYPSKLAILQSIMEHSNQLILRSAVDALAAAPAPQLRIAYLAGAQVAAQLTSPRTCYLIDHELRAIDRTDRAGQQILKLRHEYEDLWRQEIADGVARGDFVVADYDVTRLSLLGMFSSASLWYRPNKSISIHELTLKLIDLGLNTLGRTPLGHAEGIAMTNVLDLTPWPSEPPAPTALSRLPDYAELMMT